MPAFIPHSMRTHRKTLRSYCKWCARRDLRKNMYKGRDGPVDHFFCNQEHALEWLDYRHSCVAVNALLKMIPSERECVLKGEHVADWVQKEITKDKFL